jgi:hypothetical protein
MKIQARLLPTRIRNLRHETTRNAAERDRKLTNGVRRCPPSRRARTFINVPAASYNSANDTFLRIRDFPARLRTRSVSSPRNSSRRISPFSRTRADASSLSHRHSHPPRRLRRRNPIYGRGNHRPPPPPACPIGGIGLIPRGSFSSRIFAPVSLSPLCLLLHDPMTLSPGAPLGRHSR